MGKFLYFLVLLVIVAGAFAAPKEESAETKEVASTEPKKASSATAEERNVLVADETWNTWMKSSSYNIMIASLGTVFVLAGFGVVFYYVYYVNYNRNAPYDNSNFQGTPNSYGSYNYPQSTTYAR